MPIFMKAGWGVNMRLIIISFSIVMLMTTLDVITLFSLYLRIWRRIAYMHSIRTMTLLIAKFLLRCRRERTSLIDTMIWRSEHEFRHIQMMRDEHCQVPSDRPGLTASDASPGR